MTHQTLQKQMEIEWIRFDLFPQSARHGRGAKEEKETSFRWRCTELLPPCEVSGSRIATFTFPDCWWVRFHTDISMNWSHFSSWLVLVQSASTFHQRKSGAPGT
jgi:hypothetical protein